MWILIRGLEFLESVFTRISSFSKNSERSIKLNVWYRYLQRHYHILAVLAMPSAWGVALRKFELVAHKVVNKHQISTIGMWIVHVIWFLLIRHVALDGSRKRILTPYGATCLSDESKSHCNKNNGSIPSALRLNLVYLRLCLFWSCMFWQKNLHTYVFVCRVIKLVCSALCSVVYVAYVSLDLGHAR